MNVEHIYISPEAGKSQQSCQKIELVAGKGIVGDRNYGLSKWPGQNLTLIELEEIERFIREQNIENDLSITRRNILTRGVRLNELVGKEFNIGDVTLRGVELCEPCRSLGAALESSALSSKLVIERFLHRGGLRVDVLTSGAIELGAKITSLNNE
ncbi:MAG: sulfurase [Porticoccus sp.]|nr:sulfurase [Porticoccus sp.]